MEDAVRHRIFPNLVQGHTTIHGQRLCGRETVLIKHCVLSEIAQSPLQWGVGM